MWRRRLQLAIAAFVVIFAAVVVLSLRRGRVEQPPAPAGRQDPNSVVEAQGGATYERSEKGKTKFAIKFGRQLTYQNGRTRLLDGVALTLPDRQGRTVDIRSNEATLLQPPDRDLARAEFAGNVVMTTSDGVRVSAAHASYDDAKALVTIPGRLTFTKGRTKGAGVGATYDTAANILHLRTQVEIDVPPGDDGGEALHATAGEAVLERDDHRVRLEQQPRIDGGTRTIEADTTTIHLSQDDQRVERAELRGRSRITGKAADAPSMQARDIDLVYAPDGRTLRTAALVEDASVDLPADGSSGRRVAGRTIDITMAEDGSTVTALTAKGAVQVDLPAAADAPARRIRSQTLVASGQDNGGLDNATFTGSVTFNELRPAAKDAPAVERTARSESLTVRTAPGFGDVQQATFRGSVHFTNGETAADAPVAVYDVAADRIDLQPAQKGERGMGPHVTDGRVVVDARSIRLGLGSDALNAETSVRSLLQPASEKGSKGSAARGDVKVPAMLKKDRPVNVTSRALAYDSHAGRAVYTGDARLWQDETTINADTIEIDDRTGNLKGDGHVTTVTFPVDTDDQTGAKKTAPTLATGDHLLYEDATRRATYTTKAHVNGPQGDITGDRIELYLTASGDELERAEADGSVIAREDMRRVYGTHLTYIGETEKYTMVGTPVKAYDDTAPNCKLTVGATLTFYRSVDRIDAVGNELYPTQTTPIACGTERKS
jgi:lipopolysaccharide transport protein LptA